MEKIVLRILACICTPLFVSAQLNEVPILKIVEATRDTAKRQINIVYDVSDAEESVITVTLKASEDAGVTYLLSTSGAKGDIGDTISVGKSKTITWTYPDRVDVDKLRLKLIADDLFKINIKDLVNQVSEERLTKDVNMFAKERNSYSPKALQNLKNVRRAIERNYTASGVGFERQVVSYPEKIKFSGQNIIARMPGQYNDSKTYILSAHYDCARYSPGADDNATGIAGVLEAMRILSKYHYSNAIRFINFDLEEEGCLGSKAYVDQNFVFNKDKKEVLDGVINYDMIGFYSEKKNSQYIPEGFAELFPEAVAQVQKDANRGNFVVNSANVVSKALGEKFTACSRKYIPELKVVSLVALEAGDLTPNLAASDHYEFWVNGFKALHIGDGGESRNTNLNGPKDVLKNVNIKFMTNVVKATVGTLAELADIKHVTIIHFNTTDK